MPFLDLWSYKQSTMETHYVIDDLILFKWKWKYFKIPMVKIYKVISISLVSSDITIVKEVISIIVRRWWMIANETTNGVQLKWM